MARQNTSQLTTTFNNGNTVDGVDHSNWFSSSLNYIDTTTSEASGSFNLVSGSIYITGSLQATGSISRGDWEDGYLGNSEFIPILPTDFSLGELALTSRPQTTFIDGLFVTHSGGSVINPITHIAIPFTTTQFYASKIIPKGYEVYAVGVSGSNMSSGVDSQCRTYSSSLSVNSVFTFGGVAINSGDFALSPTIIGNGDNYAVLSWRAAVADTGDAEFWGGKFYIRRI